MPASASRTHKIGLVVGRLPFRVVQPYAKYGKDKARESMIISEHATAAGAFAEIDRLSSEMARTGALSNAIELLAVDAERRIVLPCSRDP